ncbi:hypothetical protein JQ543_05460 [Bradyrhizobium diazoefficiens]|nr:hypothetical protein [Bradyrhizobium diazoefficiens]MBR0847189.1 hypothetical protein [Bradyrhizobium diazoefficiens]
MSQEPPVKRQSQGLFAVGHRKVGGRRKGTPNKATADIKACFIEAARNIGSDGKGKGGVRGFIEKTGRANPEALMLALSRFVPPPLKQDADVSSVVVVNVGAVPANKYLHASDVAKMIEAEPLVIDNDEDAA